MQFLIFFLFSVRLLELYDSTIQSQIQKQFYNVLCFLIELVMISIKRDDAKKNFSSIELSHFKFKKWKLNPVLLKISV